MPSCCGNWASRDDGFTRDFTARPSDIDELGHVNNAVWVQWIQEIALAHWDAIAPAEHQEALCLGRDPARDRLPRQSERRRERVTAETWVGDAARARGSTGSCGSRADGKTMVEAVTTWALIEKATGRLVRITPELAAPFLPFSAPA